MNLVEHKRFIRKGFSLNISGKKIKFRLSYNSLVASFPRGERECVIKAIHDYLIDFFGSSIEYHWKSEGFEAHFISQPQNLSLSAAVRLNLNFEDMKLLDLFFSTSPVLKSVNMFTSIGNKPFHTESKIYQAESIEIDQFFNTVPNVLSRFQGRQAFLETLRYRISDLIGFVNLWKSGQAFQNLEYLQMRIGCHEIPQDEIFSAIKAKFIAGTKKPLTHTLPKVHIGYDKKPKTDPITSHTYVVRDSDNRVASILIQAKTFSFGVWDIYIYSIKFFLTE
ncbi:Protein CBG13995 [Caenorhabditis briggsae]|uniref:Protein CBG13995 n=1 Tax=Caenorhabditis briggsae TaxID=6238 RepID=A8XJ62_CAEBR|nr:Protein CBG13995 [Caenorhabditis briggsae]CAP32687.1 Protein CBG13995 [Caenorhabditis briggsae]